MRSRRFVQQRLSAPLAVVALVAALGIAPPALAENLEFAREGICYRLDTETNQSSETPGPCQSGLVTTPVRGVRQIFTPRVQKVSASQAISREDAYVPIMNVEAAILETEKVSVFKVGGGYAVRGEMAVSVNLEVTKEGWTSFGAPNLVWQPQNSQITVSVRDIPVVYFSNSLNEFKLVGGLAHAARTQVNRVLNFVKDYIANKKLPEADGVTFKSDPKFLTQLSNIIVPALISGVESGFGDVTSQLVGEKNPGFDPTPSQRVAQLEAQLEAATQSVKNLVEQVASTEAYNLSLIANVETLTQESRLRSEEITALSGAIRMLEGTIANRDAYVAATATYTKSLYERLALRGALGEDAQRRDILAAIAALQDDLRERDDLLASLMEMVDAKLGLSICTSLARTYGGAEEREEAAKLHTVDREQEESLSSEEMEQAPSEGEAAPGPGGTSGDCDPIGSASPIISAALDEIAAREDRATNEISEMTKALQEVRGVVETTQGQLELVRETTGGNVTRELVEDIKDKLHDQVIPDLATLSGPAALATIGYLRQEVAATAESNACAVEGALNTENYACKTISGIRWLCCELCGNASSANSCYTHCLARHPDMARVASDAPRAEGGSPLLETSSALNEALDDVENSACVPERAVKVKQFLNLFDDVKSAYYELANSLYGTEEIEVAPADGITINWPGGACTFISEDSNGWGVTMYHGVTQADGCCKLNKLE